MESDLVDDGLNDVAIIELETHDAILDMSNEIEGQFLIDVRFHSAICLIMEYEGKKIYKSTLVSQFNENLFLFKDNQPI
jgi:hypothetical protein